ncbi:MULTISPECIES: hypothetical protein [unclassified Kitasatospora]|uniref:hypothetical protein n=1 Tax=unclassified Kitasatospora TaxID=2633591 RepID=UPI0033CB88AF
MTTKTIPLPVHDAGPGALQDEGPDGPKPAQQEREGGREREQAVNEVLALAGETGRRAAGWPPAAPSILGPEHLPIWKAERTSLTLLRADPALPKNRRAALDAQLHEVDLMIRRTEK